MTINYALIDNEGKVVNLIVFESENQELAEQVLTNSGFSVGKFSNDENVIVGGYYFNDRFYPLKPFESWIPNPDEPAWIAPVPKPDSGFWKWNEDTLSWQELPLSEV